MNKAFIKVPRDESEPGKGAFWTIDPVYGEQFTKGIYKKARRSSDMNSSGVQSSSPRTPSKATKTTKNTKSKTANTTVTPSSNSNSINPTTTTTDNTTPSSISMSTAPLSNFSMSTSSLLGDTASSSSSNQQGGFSRGTDFILESVASAREGDHMRQSDDSILNDNHTLTHGIMNHHNHTNDENSDVHGHDGYNDKKEISHDALEVTSILDTPSTTMVPSSDDIATPLFSKDVIQPPVYIVDNPTKRTILNTNTTADPDTTDIVGNDGITIDRTRSVSPRKTSTDRG